MLYTYIIFYQIVSLMIQFCTENKLFSILKSSDTACFLGNCFFDIVFAFSEFLVTSILLCHICKVGFSLYVLFDILYLFFTIFLAPYFLIYHFIFKIFLVSVLFIKQSQFRILLIICIFYMQYWMFNFP